MTSMNPAPSLFDSFNARSASTERLAADFIPSHHFEAITRRGHTLVIGPRGSGKTCLLKMLQPRTLNAWRSKDAKLYKEKIDFIGVYIPADISWSQQLKYLSIKDIPNSLQRQLESAVITAHVLHSFISTLIDLATIDDPLLKRFRIRLTDSKEIQIVETLAKRWRLKITAPTFLALKHAIRARGNDIWLLAQSFSDDNESQKTDRDRSILNFDFLNEIQYLIEVIDDYTGRDDSRWALLFDELEIAPAWMLETLLAAFRSVGQKLLLKLTISPYTPIDAFSKPNAPQSGQDFELIRLWYGYKQEGKEFSRKLFSKILSAAHIEDTDPESILGMSPLKGGENEGLLAYSEGSRHQRLLLNAYQQDPSFKAYCDKNAIDLKNIEKLSESDRASLIRKITPTLIIRQAFRRFDDTPDDKVVLRSRKRPDIYSGSETFFEVLEANPRWMIGILQDMIPMIKRTGRVGANKQLELTERTGFRFSAMLATFPLGNSGIYAETSLVKALEVIGKHIHNSVIADKFSPEPLGSFIIDSKTPKSVYDALGTALNAGAIVAIPSGEDEQLGEGLFGKRFRLSYLLSPLYRIPVRLGRAFPLSTALNKLDPDEKLSRVELHPSDQNPKGGNQLELFR